MFKSKSACTGKHSEYIHPNFFGVAADVSGWMRKKMFSALMRMADPHPDISVLDVGVTFDTREECNFFEKMYPFPQRITAVGTEDAAFLEKDFPGLKFLFADGMCLPFKDKSFDLVVSFATLEHVGSRQHQKIFLQELCRVGNECFVTTPNRYFPVEIHTSMPFLHWLPRGLFRRILHFFKKDFFAKENNLNFLSIRDILKILPAVKEVEVKRFRIMGFTSNLMVRFKP